MNILTPPPDGFLDAALTRRPARWEDLQAVARLIHTVCAADGDTSVATTPEDLAENWKYEGFAPEQDAFVVQTREGQLVGYAELINSEGHYHLGGDLYVHPDHRSQGIHSALLEALDIRGTWHIPRAAPERRVFIRLATDHKDEAGKACCSHAGYRPIRYYWRMGIELTSPPPAPVLPAGFAFVPFVKDKHAEAVWLARNESFRDHWGSHPISFEKFSYFYFETAEYDPALWAVIWDGDQVAGFSINQYRMDIGWVRTLGVRPAWRKHGLGLALLHWSFGKFYQRGTTSIGLSVDAANPTGATRLYQRAGMQAMSEFVMFEKELRPGVDEPYSSKS